MTAQHKPTTVLLTYVEVGRMIRGFLRKEQKLIVPERQEINLTVLGDGLSLYVQINDRDKNPKRRGR